MGVVLTRPSGTLTMHRADGSIVAEGTYSDLRIEVEDEIHGGDEPIPFTVTKGIFLAVDEVGSPQWRRPKDGTKDALSFVREEHARDQPEGRAERRRRERELRTFR